MNNVFNNVHLLDKIIRSNNYNIKEYLTLRLIDKNFYLAIKEYVNRMFSEDEIACSSRTMFKINECMICNVKKDEKLLNFHYYLQDPFPLRTTIFCDNYKCYIKAKRTLVNNSFIKNNIIYLKNILDCKDEYLIPRSDGSKTLSYLEKSFLVIYNNEIYFKFKFNHERNTYYKICNYPNLLIANPNDESLILLSKQISVKNISYFYDFNNYKKIETIINEFVCNLDM